MSKEIETHILQIYEIVSYLGSGAYGHVWKVQNRANGKDYALKKIFDAFQNDVDAQRTYREVTILPQLQHENIIKLYQVVKAHNGRDLYLVFEFMESDLHSILGSKILQDMHIRFITYQLCKVLKYIHSAQIIHRDLKSSNILVNSSCEGKTVSQVVKICDFGLVRSLIHEEEAELVLSEDVATRWYRSPQMLLGSHTYGKATDMWSLGCIVAELIRGQPIFAGNSTLHQLEKIIEFTGMPSKDCLKSLQTPMAETILSQIKVKKRHLRSYFDHCDQDIKDLILRMLEFDPNMRITAEEALELPCLQEYRGKCREDICNRFITTDLDDNRRLTLEQYRRKIYCDIQRKYPASNSNLVMPRITRSHNSLQSRSFHQTRKIANSSLAKIQKNTTFHQSQDQKITNKEYKNYCSYKKSVFNQKENEDSTEYSIYNKQSSHKDTGKVFKRRLKANLWAKNQ